MGAHRTSYLPNKVSVCTKWSTTDRESHEFVVFFFNTGDVNRTVHYACIKSINRMMAFVGVGNPKKGKTMCPFCNHVYENRCDIDACLRCGIPIVEDET